MFEELKDVFALATGCTAFVNELLKIKNTKNKLQQNDNNGYYAKLASSGDYAQLASSGYYAQLASSGYSAKLASSGDYAQLASSGDSAKLASSGDYAQLASSGYSAQLASSGYSAQLASSGYSAQLASSGDSAQLASSGDYAKLASSGDYAQLASSGYYAKLASSGDYAQLESTGEKSVISATGFNNIAKAKKGSWITLAEYEKDIDGKWVVSHVKTEYVDGERIKEDTWYILKDKNFQECVYIDGIISLLIQKRKNVFKVKNLGEENISYVVQDGELYSHGSTIKEAKEGLKYKISNRDTSKYDDYTKETELTLREAIEMYRVITGACEPGTKYFVEQVLTDKKEKYTVQEVINLTQGQYNHNLLVEFFERN